MRAATRAVLALTALSALACADLTGGGASTQTCDLSLSTLDGTMWVMAEAMPDKSTVPNPQARLKFFQEDGKQKALYTVKSLGDVYTYDCGPLGEGEWLCREPAKVEDWCRALETHQRGSCTAARLRELGADDVSDADLQAAIKRAVAEVDKARGGDQWRQFQLLNNNLGNKLRGLLYVSPNMKRCDLKITDMYMTIYDGQKIEDSNVVGTNPFERTTDELQWEACTDARTLADLEAPERIPPDQIPPQRMHALGKPVHYVYYGDVAVQPEPGCTYSYDAYAMWRPIAKDVAVSPGADGRLDWRAEHTFTAESGTKVVDPVEPKGVYAMVRYKTCGGAKQKIDVTCNVARVD